MITLFIFKSNARGMQYGLGTYISQLTESLLKYTDLKIFLVNYKSYDHSEFTIDKLSEYYSEVFIPSPKFPTDQNASFDKKYAETIVRLLSVVIPSEGKVIFQVNYIDDMPIMIKLKEDFDYPVICVVQFAQWQQLYNGNKQKMAQLNIDQPSDNYEFTFNQERKMYQISDHIISVTQYMKEFLIYDYGIDPGKISVIPNGINYKINSKTSRSARNILRKKLGFRNDEILVLFSGRIDPCKGVYYLLDAFKVAVKINNNLRLIFMGQGDIEGCFKKLDSSYGKISFTGFLKREVVDQFYTIADIGIVPSIYDHCPLTILEMMSYKIPLIISRIPGPDEMLDESQCLFIDPVISDSGDIGFNNSEITDSILLLSENIKLRHRLAYNAIKVLHEKFSAELLAINMKSIFQRIYNNPILINEKLNGR
jgi:glycosyltransferase involved in cell wall biosynthesis